MNTNTQHPRHRRTDILSCLPKGAQRRIAVQLHCDESTVSHVLNGKQGQHTPLAIKIITLAERAAGLR